MDRRARNRAVLVVPLLVTVLFSGCFTPFWMQDDALPQWSALFGLPSSGRLGPTGVFDGVGVVDFNGCFLMDVDEVANRGRVVSDGYVDQYSRLVARLEEFRGPNATHGGGVGVDVPAAGTLPRGQQVLPSIENAMAGWGNATLELNGVYLDDVFSGEYNFTTHFLVTDDGFTDDATGQVHARDGSIFSLDDPTDVAQIEDDWEAHLVVHSHDSGEFQTKRDYINRDDGGGMILSDESYSREELFVVQWLGGLGEFDITVNGTTLLEAGRTSLTFRFFDPDGVELANTTIAPSGTTATSVTERVEFPTKRLGTYSFTVDGPAHAATYKVTATLRAPESYRLHFLWEEKDETTPVKRFDQCVASKDSGAPVSGNTNIARPPGLDLRVIAFGVLGTLVASLLVVKLVLDARKIDEFKSKFGKK